MEKSDLWLEIIEKMKQRRQIGLDQYGVPVTADATVDWFNHAEEEQLDNLVYTKAATAVYKELVKAALSVIVTSEEACKYLDEMNDRKNDDSFVITEMHTKWKRLSDLIPQSYWKDWENNLSSY
jgi:hypothetical protein